MARLPTSPGLPQLSTSSSSQWEVLRRASTWLTRNKIPRASSTGSAPATKSNGRRSHNGGFVQKGGKKQACFLPPFCTKPPLWVDVSLFSHHFHTSQKLLSGKLMAHQYS